MIVKQPRTNREDLSALMKLREVLSREPTGYNSRALYAQRRIPFPLNRNHPIVRNPNYYIRVYVSSDIYVRNEIIDACKLIRWEQLQRLKRLSWIQLQHQPYEDPWLQEVRVLVSKGEYIAWIPLTVNTADTPLATITSDILNLKYLRVGKFDWTIRTII